MPDIKLESLCVVCKLAPWPVLEKHLVLDLCVVPVIKNPPANAGDIEMLVRYLGLEDPLEEGMTTHSSIVAWRIHMERGAWQSTVHRLAQSQT